ncbi:MAG: carboxymuconolactone decarboxylase family protein, partial [Trebonia sp.]
AYCLDMHSKDARALGETEQRLYALNAWRETEFYTEPERATLAFTEAVTELRDGEIPDECFESLRKHFDEPTIGRILTAIVVINSWNRLMIAQRPSVGDYVSRHAK